MPSDCKDEQLNQTEEEIVPEEWDEFCKEVILAHAGNRLNEDQHRIYERKEV